ncbi:MAG: hypothetical protein ACSHX0_12745 [Akkermansiaceae bacterium]
MPEKQYFLLPFSLFALLLLSSLALIANPPPSEWQIIEPADTGEATGSNYFPLNHAFDGVASWDSINAEMTGTAGANVAPPYASRHGYIDFGADYDQVHIMETWTRYRSYSGGSKPGYVEMWWDGDKDNINDDGVLETRLNFNSGQGIPHLSTELWFRDKRVNELGGVIPKNRYLIIKSSSTYADRAQEYAMTGYIYDGLVPPEYADALFFDIDSNTIAENGDWQQAVGELSLRGGTENENYTLSYDSYVGDNASFKLIGQTLWTTQSFDYESQSAYILYIDAIAESDNSRTSLELEISITDLTGDFDTNGPASAAVAAAYPEINQGDFVIWNATNSAGPEISYNDGSFNLSYPNKILIKGGKYSQIILDLSGVNGLDADRRVPITNFRGQVYANQIGITDGNYWRLTGKYDPALGLGDEDFPGCTGPNETANFAYSTGSYGIWASNEWVNESSSMIYVSGTANGCEIDHIEISDGGFAGMILKKDSGTVDMDEVHLHHLYIHDTGSEGIYLGSTQTDPQHQFNQLTVEKCVILRTGTEALQTGQLGADSIIQNNVLWGAMDWMSPFQAYQDNCVQLNTRQGGVIFRNNILLGAAEKFFNVSNIPKASITPNGRNIEFLNNVAWGCRGIAAAYQFQQSDGSTGWEWHNNFFGGFVYTYDLVWPNAYDNGSCIMVPTNQAITVNASNNIYDSSRDRMLIRWSSGQAVMTETNNLQKTVLPPRFINLLGEDATLDVLRWNRWSAKIGEDASFGNSSGNNNKGNWINYNVGDIVQYYHEGHSRFYRCLQDHFNQEPPLNGNQFWELLTWTSPEGHLQYCPPDDARLVEGSLYHQLGIGLRGNGTTDTDGDELPDDWEQRHGLDPNSDEGDHGAQGNPDKDHRKNLAEYQANSDPQQTDGHTEMLISKQGSQIKIIAKPNAGRSWRMETSATLSSWNPDPDWQASEGDITIEQLPSATATFYRLDYTMENEMNLLP